MYEYQYEIELKDGFIIEYQVWAASRVAADIELGAYLEECNVDPNEICTIDVCVYIPEDEEVF